MNQITQKERKESAIYFKARYTDNNRFSSEDRKYTQFT